MELMEGQGLRERPESPGWIPDLDRAVGVDRIVVN